MRRNRSPSFDVLAAFPLIPHPADLVSGTTHRAGEDAEVFRGRHTVVQQRPVVSAEPRIGSESSVPPVPRRLRGRCLDGRHAPSRRRVLGGQRDGATASPSTETARGSGRLRTSTEPSGPATRDAIIVLVDGDDFLAHPQVLTRLNAIYQDPDVWVTWGQFTRFPQDSEGFCAPIPSEIVSANAFRDYPFVSSHLRTFYAGLYQRIRPVDLQDSAGQFFTTAGDVAQMWALHEMAGPHGRFVDEVLYQYNRENPLNDDKLDRGGQVRTEREIRRKARYGRVRSLSWCELAERVLRGHRGGPESLRGHRPRFRHRPAVSTIPAVAVGPQPTRVYGTGDRDTGGHR